MYELFKDIDVNGDGQLEWQEFTSFTVEKANLLNKRAKLTSIAHYHDSSHSLDPSAFNRHRHDISRFVNIPSLGQFAIVEDHRNSIFVFNARLGKCITTVATESAPIAIETLQEKDKVSLVTSGADMTLSTYSLDDPNPKRRYKVQSTWATPGVQMALAYASESRLLYTGATNSNIYSWNVGERNLVSTLTGHTDIVMSLIVLQKLNNLASASLDKTISVWDSHTNEQILRLHGHKKGVFDLTYNPNFRLLFSCGFEHDACVWSPFVNSMVYRLKGHHASLVGCQSVENSPEVLTADTSGIIKLWDVRNFQCIQTFSANLSGQETKDNSKMTCFFHSKMPSRNALQKEDDSRIYAASKMLFSFDQARVVHEATTDYTNVCWVAWNTDNPVIITASERNVIIWDALIGSKTFTHTNICGEEISACCLDDRKRKIVIGDVTGRIGVYNYANGALMKTVHYEADKRSIVVSVEYFDEAKRFIAGYANGLMCLYDENVLEECHLIRSFEHFNQHPELLSLKFNPFNRMAATAGGSSGLARLWDYDSGKCENELNVCYDGEGHIVHLSLLLPYPIVVTADSAGNIVLWGSRGLKWQGFRIAGFSNATPASADLEPRMWKSDDEGEGAPRRAVPPESAASSGVDANEPVFSGKDADGIARQQSRVRVAEEEDGDSNQLKLMLLGRKSALSFSMADDLSLDARELEKRTLSEQQVEREILDSEAKWGKLSAAHTMCWDPNSLRLFTADDLGCLRCYSLKNIFLDLQITSPDPDHPDQFVYNSGNGSKTMGICKRKKRDDRSAVPCRAVINVKEPTPMDLFVLGKRNDATAYQGVDFCWALDAHNDRIITCTSTPHGVLTSAADRLVKMWTFDGLPVGTLLQSVPVSTRSRTWDLVLDVESIIRRENLELDAMIEQVTELSLRSDRPDIEHMDFTGMQLGADSADFSRSQLRQRIEKTGKLLGLDFPSHKAHPRSSAHGQLDDTSVLEASTVGSVSKSLEDALREIKSTDSAVDYDTKTKQMSYIQQRRKATKLETISKAFEARLEAKTGVRVHVGGASVSGASHHSAVHGKHKSIAESAEEHSAEEGDENEGDLDQMLISLADVKPRDDASANNDMYSHGSNDHLQSKHHYVSKRRETKSKIAESIKSAHDRGPRTISMSRSCAKYAASDELNLAMARRPNQQISSEQVLEMRKRREEKHKLFFVAVTSDNVAKMRANQAKDGMLSRIREGSEAAPNASSNSLLVSQSLDSLDAATTLHTEHSQTSYQSGSSDVVH
eukprot:gene22221-28335_t